MQRYHAYDISVKTTLFLIFILLLFPMPSPAVDINESGTEVGKDGMWDRYLIDISEALGTYDLYPVTYLASMR